LFSRGQGPTGNGRSPWTRQSRSRSPSGRSGKLSKRVKANQGTAGVDGQSIAEFEADLRNNLYKLWNRLSSGSYFPPPVRRVNMNKSGIDVADAGAYGPLRTVEQAQALSSKPENFPWQLIRAIQRSVPLLLNMFFAVCGLTNSATISGLASRNDFF